MEKDHGSVAPKAFRPRTESWVLVLVGLLLAGLFVFVAWPLWKVLETAFLQGQDPLEFLRNTPFLTPLRNSLILGFSVATLGTLMGYLLAYLVVRTGVWGSGLFRSLTFFSMVAPPFMLALTAIMLLGRNGVVTQWLQSIFGPDFAFSVYGFWGLLGIETIAYFPTAFLVMAGVFTSIDPVLEEAAQNQGANRWRVFWDLIFPVSIPGILSSFLLIFIETLADFGNPLILSGDFKVLSVEAYMKITGEFDTAGGSILSFLLLIPCLIAFFLQRSYAAKKSYVTLTGKPSSSRRQRAPWPIEVLKFSTAALLSFPLLVGYGGAAYGSFVQIWGVDHSLTLGNYAKALEHSSAALWDSLVLSFIAAPLSAFFGILLAYLLVRKRFVGKALLEGLSLMTFAIPGTVVGIGYVLAFNDQPLLLTGTAAIIVLLFLFRNAPVGIQSGITALRQMDPSIEEASSSLGASPLRTFRSVVIPLLAPAFFSGLAHSFVRSMTAVSAVIFVVSGEWRLVTVSILAFVENSLLTQASAMCMIMMVIVSGVLGVFHLLTTRMGVQAR